MKTVLLLSLFFALPAFSFADEPADPGAVPAKDKLLHKRLERFVGDYELTENDEKAPCRLLISEDKNVRLTLMVSQERDEYGAEPGDVNFLIQQNYTGLNKWARAFDRADFSGIGKSKRVFRLDDGLKITHISGYTDSARTLSHQSTMSQFLKGSSTANQRIVFDDDANGFTYTYTLFEGFGLMKRDVMGSCRFTRKP